MACALAHPALARDTPSIQLTVDATDTAHKILRAHETLAVSPGPLVLYLPAWLPGTHSRSASAERVTGLQFKAAGQSVSWTRDAVDPFKFSLQIPPGASSLEMDLIFLTPATPAGGRVFIDGNITEVEWYGVTLYPADAKPAELMVHAQVTLPSGYRYACALESESFANNVIDFKPASLETLIDSPLISGRYFKRIDLNPGQAPPVNLDVVADQPEQLEATDAAIQSHQQLVRQALLLFGTTHYAHYDFLFSISDEIGGIGLEHHQSSEDGVGAGYFTHYDDTWNERGLLSHEYTHSWNGKYRRPADLATPNYNTPMQGTLLWVYEGQTDYWGNVLASRAGFESEAQAHDTWAATAALVDGRVGRSWRDLEDTTRGPIMGYSGIDWLSWQRNSADYYREMDFVWLQVDAMIRKASDNHKSLDDFARLFFGQEPGQRKVTTYHFEDVVKALSTVAPGTDWAAFLHERLQSHTDQPAKDALAAAGWHVEYSDAENLFLQASGKSSKRSNWMSSIGITLGRDDEIDDVQWDGPAFRAGAIRGVKLIAVNGEAYTSEGLKQAIKNAKSSSAPIVLLIKDGPTYRSLDIDYHEGLRYPHLVRDAQGADYLSAILAPRS